MTATDEAEILSALNSATAKRPAEVVGEPWPEVYCGNVTFAIGGWTIVVFNDCMSWDYIDNVTAPDGRSWDYDELPEQVRFWTPASLDGWPTVSFGAGARF